jgi:hypothetical protein
MKVDLDSIDRTQFYVNERVLNGEAVYLVFPQHIGATWTRDNKVFRSSVWNANGELISAGFPKFTNWGEKPEVFPLPDSLKGATVMEKLDGSLLIVSKYKGQIILRTRGTIDATELDNGHELELFKQTILPKIASLDSANTWEVSYLFEWVSPNQKIILNYGDQPDWYLVGVIGHTHYQLLSQEALDSLAKDLGLKRPATYTFTDAEDLLANVDQWKGKEGVCVYHNGDQSIHKVKSAWYLMLHHMKSEFSSYEKVMDAWFGMGKPDYQTFYNNVVTQLDYEIANQAQGDMSRIVDGWKEVQKIEAGMVNFIKNELSKYPTRKLQAVVTFQSYGKGSNRSSFVFKLLDGKTLNDDDYKKLLFQVTKD